MRPFAVRYNHIMDTLDEVKGLAVDALANLHGEG